MLRSLICYCCLFFMFAIFFAITGFAYLVFKNAPHIDAYERQKTSAEY